MAPLNPQAEELNLIIKTHSPTVYELLSSKGKAIYFPRKGILAQGAAAKDKEINATIGTAYEDDGKPMVLPSLASRLQLDAKDNRVVIGSFSQLSSHRLIASRLSWVSGKAPPDGDSITARVRYKSPGADATLHFGNDTAEVRFSQPQRAISPGQSVVFYQGEEVLGGGIIELSEPAKGGKADE